jgi:ArsR family transcriptional regulator
LKALAHPVRLQIVDLLRRHDLCVCQIESVLGKRQAYISQQLMVLREAGPVEAHKDGLLVYYCLADPLVAELLSVVLGAIASFDESLSSADLVTAQESV